MISLASPALPNGIPILIELCPLEKLTALLPRHVTRMTHPEVLAPILPLPLHNPKHGRHPTLALGSELGVQTGSVVAIRDVDALVAGNGVRINGRRGCDAVFPFLLHLRVHDEQGVVREVDRDLAGRVACGFFGFGTSCCGCG